MELTCHAWLALVPLGWLLAWLLDERGECGVVWGPRRLSREVLEACQELNRLEEAAGGSDEQATARYEAKLASWRLLDMREQPACRMRALGEDMLKMARAYRRVEPDPRENAHYEGGASETMMAHLAEPAMARCFAARYVPYFLAPHFFHYPDWVQVGEADDILADPEYGAVYAAAGHLAPHFGAPQVALDANRFGAKLRTKRAINLVHYRNMRGALRGFHLDRLSQVWEFGTGTGDLVAMIRDLGYKGTYLVYDLYPMLVFAQYWLRYSGLPAYMDSQLLPGVLAARNRTVMSPSTDGSVFNRLDRERLGETLFVAFESFSEAQSVHQEKIWDWIKQCGFIIISFEDEWLGRDNVPTFARLAEELEATHEVLVWRGPKGAGMPSWQGDYSMWANLAAVRRDLGKVACAPPSSCSRGALHPAFDFLKAHKEMH